MKSLNPFTSGSIRRILTLLVCLAVLPALLIIVYSGLELRREAIANAKREVMFLVRTMGDVQEGITHSTHQILATLAQLNEVRRLDGLQSSAIFRAVVEKDPDYINIVAMDTRGDIFASAMPFDPTNLGDRIHFHHALAEKRFATGEYIVTRVGQIRPSFPFAYPVLDGRGKPVAVLSAALHLERFAHLLEVAKLPPDSFLAVTDRNGIRLFYHPAKVRTNPVGKPIVKVAWDIVRNTGKPGISIHTGSDGLRRIFAYQPVFLENESTPYMYMWAGISEAAVLGPANMLLARNLGLMVLVFLLALAISWLVGGRGLLSPIRRLVTAAHALAGGELHVRCQPGQAPDELKTLARAFNDMADALVKNQETLRTIADHTYDWEYWIGPDGRLLWMSPSCKKITGYLPEEFLADPTLLERIVAPADKDIFNRHLAAEKGTGEADDLDFRIADKSGQPVWIDHHCVPIVRSDGTFLGRRVSNRDISDRKRLESHLQQAQKMEAIGALAGGIAHDFNNLLFPILGYSEMLQTDLPAGSSNQEKVAQIHRAARRAGDLVRQILSFSRQVEHKKIPLLIQHVVKEAGKLARATIPSNIEIRQDIQSDCRPVMADPTNVHQIVMNLLTNALHAVEKNGGRIAVDLHEAVLTQEDTAETTLTPGPHAILKVSDNGCGIAPESLSRIFDPFFTTKPRGKGTGMGLAVVYGIVKDHGGDIRVQSQPGEGTVFTVCLPLSQRNESSGGASEEVRILPAGSESILLVDDEEAIVRMEKQILERLGYRVTICTNGLEALETFKADPAAFDLVITDMAMPEMTGDRLARHLTAARADIPVILCTGFSEKTSTVGPADIPLKGLLMKPVVTAELAATVRKVLDEAQSVRRGLSES